MSRKRPSRSSVSRAPGEEAQALASATEAGPLSNAPSLEKLSASMAPAVEASEPPLNPIVLPPSFHVVEETSPPPSPVPSARPARARRKPSPPIPKPAPQIATLETAGVILEAPIPAKPAEVEVPTPPSESIKPALVEVAGVEKIVPEGKLPQTFTGFGAAVTFPQVAKDESPAEVVPISEDKILGDVPQLVESAVDEAPEQTPPETEATSVPAIPSMFVAMISPELAPVAKVGGLGDVVFGLARELELRGHAVEVLLPKYSHMRYDHIWGLTKTYENLWVPWYGGAINTSIWFGFVHGRKCFFIEPHSQDNFFSRGVYYGQNDDVMRFAFFCRAALEFMFKTGKHPDIIHCHDWQTAIVPVLLYEMYQHLGMRHSRVCFTIHNFRHQGVTGGQLLQATGLHRPEHFFHYDRMRDNHNPQALNLMKAGIVYSNFVTTVSPRHAWEAKDAGQAHGLELTLHTHHYKFGGVLNGLDYDYFNPETDRHIPATYNKATIERKYDNKRALRGRFWLQDNEKPIISFIGRLDAQKGLELVRHAIFYALNHRAQFVLLGNSPERGINDHFLGLKHHLNNSPDCHLEIGYHEELAHLIYAGSDMMVVPSRYEPCGLTQLISLRYGTVPIVRSVGGLADTVFDKDHSSRPLHERNGYVFDHADNAGIESALDRAIGCYYDFPQHFRDLLLNGMRCDYSWKFPGQHYLNIFEYIRDK